ncbi:MAG: hypothetical protein U5L96_16105 [Owenweeksia sp.]|nr:hypothetical protein [Owenweeksia sp.]
MALLTGCAKEEPSKQVYEDDYRFYAKGTASGLPFAYHAGEDSYYLETSYQFKDSVVEMTGRLAPLGNTPKNALEIKIRSQKRLAVASQFEVDKNLTAGEMPLRDATGLRRNSDNYLVSLSCDSSGSQYFNHRWVFPDGSYSSDYSLVRMVNINDYKTYPVKLETTGTNCNASVEHHINLADDCDASFEVMVLPNFKAQLILKDTVGEVSEVSWFLNNQSIKPDLTF